MDVYLLLIDDGRRLFYAGEHASTGGAPTPARAGLRGWFERRLATLHAALQDARGGIARMVRRLWEWLQRRSYADESLLLEMRKATTIELHHPTTLTGAEVLAEWGRYLANRRRRHVRWLVLDVLISPLTVVLAPLPGPNVVGYWFVYRAVRHALILRGLRTAGRAAEIWTCPSRALDGPISRDSGGWKLPDLPACEPSDLGDFLDRSLAAPADPKGETR